MSTRITVGIFVGGAAKRMGGAPKGLLSSPGENRTIVERTIGLSRGAGAKVRLVGEHPAYAYLGEATIPDASPGTGPLGALVALLEEATGGVAIALACDMPRITHGLLVRLIAFDPAAAIVAPRDGGRWSPLFARYDPARVLPVARARLARGDLALHALLDEVGAHELPVDDHERAALEDWDTPEDMTR